MSQVLSSNRLDNKNKMHKFSKLELEPSLLPMFKLGLSKSTKASTQFVFVWFINQIELIQY